MTQVEITPLELARVELPDSHPEGPGTCPVFGFLVREGDTALLVDTGVGSGHSGVDRAYRPRLASLPDALARAGVSIDRITAVVNSHLHFDHCGNNRLFSGIPLFVQQAEWDAAREPGYTVSDWVDFPGARYERISGRRAISERLELLPTPGHTPGHQSLLVRGDGGLDVVVAQAAYTAAEFERAAAEDAAASEDGGSESDYARSLAALRAEGPRRAFFSHDPRVWGGAATDPRAT